MNFCYDLIYQWSISFYRMHKDDLKIAFCEGAANWKLPSTFECPHQLYIEIIHATGNLLPGSICADP